MNRNFEKIFWGLFLIVGAVFIIVSGLGVLPTVGIVSLILTIFFVACIVKSLISLHIEGIFFPLAFLGIIYAKQLGITAIVPWTILGAALLLTVGWSILFHSCSKHHRIKKNYSKCHQTISNDDSDYVNCDVNFGATIKYVDSENFKNADLDCSFGSIKAYFDKAQIKDENAVINVDVSFGSIEIFAPKNWHIINHIDVCCSGIEEDKRYENIVTDKTIELTGKANFSGIVIHYI